MPRNPRKAKAQHARNHKRAAKRQAAHNGRRAGQKTLPMSERNQGSLNLAFARAMGQLFMQDANFSQSPSMFRNFTRKKTP